jgi:uncharacterized sodium:solute symporter family permease YidK
MSGKDKVSAIIALTVVGVYCYLVTVGKADIAGFGALAMYVIKKFLDGIKGGNV